MNLYRVTTTDDYRYPGEAEPEKFGLQPMFVAAQNITEAEQLALGFSGLSGNRINALSFVASTGSGGEYGVLILPEAETEDEKAE